MDAQAYLEKIERVIERVEDWSVLPAQPLVSVWMITFNHEQFIRQAVDGVLTQETLFPYEVVIGDDKSTDRTREIIQEYQRQYPDRIRLRLANENLHSQKIKPGIGVLSACRGKYIAMCEGDDYWTDPHKLQKQVGFLEAHPECSICSHRVAVVDEIGIQSLELPPPRYRKGISSIDDLLVYPGIHTCSTVIRNGLVTRLPEWFFNVKMGDVALFVLNAQHGIIGYVDEVMAIYRLHKGGIWSSTSASERLKNHVELYDHFLTYLDPKYHPFIRLGKSRIYLETAAIAINLGETMEAKRCLKQSIRSAPPHIHRYSIDQAVMFSRLYTPQLHQILKRTLRA